MHHKIIAIVSGIQSFSYLLGLNHRHLFKAEGMSSAVFRIRTVSTGVQTNKKHPEPIGYFPSPPAPSRRERTSNQESKFELLVAHSLVAMISIASLLRR